jgi:chorismate-pyruvate lyase
MSRHQCALWIGLSLLIAGSGNGAAQDWPDSPVARLEALALLQSLNANLLSHDSATATLERWCADHHLASPAQVIAQRVGDVEKIAGDEQRRLLQVSSGEVVRYRRVKLVCGKVELSDADNWYVPSRLTPEMNSQLDSSDTPFGKVVRPLHFQRHTISAELLWSPLPPGWELQSRLPASPGRKLAMPASVLEHRAILTLADGTPFSEVIEIYQSGVLAFTPPLPPVSVK